MTNKLNTTSKATVSEKEVVQGKCSHYWLIDSPHGPTSKGVCKLCGAVKEFNNSGLDFWREDNVSVLAGSAGLENIGVEKE